MKDKEKVYLFHGPYQNYFYKYVEYKRGTGRKYGLASIFMLQELERFFDRQPLVPVAEMLSKASVEEFVAKRPEESLKTQYMRMNFIHDFAIFVNECGGAAYVYPAEKYVKVRSDFCPYIFTHEEIRRLFEVVDHLPYRGRYPKFHLIYPMLLRILYGCGLRLNEALLLKTGDVDTTQGVLYLSNTKNGSQRCVPMSVSLWKYVDYYLEQMAYPPDYNGYFFTSPDGNHYNSTPVYVMMKKYMKAAHISREDGTPPRVHDLRHSHASLLIEMGFNILMVSQRLGHEKVETTWQTYAHLYPDKEKMLAAQLDTVKVQGITANLTIEDQLAEFMAQFQSHLKEQPALIDINSEEIIRWDPEKREGRPPLLRRNSSRRPSLTKELKPASPQQKSSRPDTWNCAA